MLNLYFSAFIAIANELVDKCNLPGKVSRLEECRDSFFVGVYMGLLGDDLPGKINMIPFTPSHAIFHMVHKSRKFEEFRPLYAILWCIRTILSVCVCVVGVGGAIWALLLQDTEWGDEPKFDPQACQAKERNQFTNLTKCSAIHWSLQIYDCMTVPLTLVPLYCSY